MERQSNRPNYSFLVETLTPEGSRLVWWRIDQSVANPNSTKDVRRLHNTVEKHLHYLHTRTELSYSVYGCGPKDEVDRMVASLGIEIS